MGRRQDSEGQVAVELVAVVPLLAVLVLALGQLALAGYGLWTAANAARAGARAALVGGNAKRAALSAVPGWLEHGAKVDPGTDGAGPVDVGLRVPVLIPGAPTLPVHAGASLGPGAGSG